MIDAVRDLFDMDDPGDPDAAAEAARDEVLTEVPRGVLSAVTEAVVERVLRRERDSGHRDLAEIYVDAVADYYDAGGPGLRDERKRRRERETLTAIGEAIDDRLAGLDQEREAHAAAERFDFCGSGSPVDHGHPAEEDVNDVLHELADRILEEGRVSAADLYAEYGTDHRVEGRFRTERWFGSRCLKALATHPDLALDASLAGVTEIEDAPDVVAVDDEHDPPADAPEGGVAGG